MVHVIMYGFKLVDLNLWQTLFCGTVHGGTQIFSAVSNMSRELHFSGD